MSRSRRRRGGAIATFDRAVDDRLVAPLRGHPAADHLFYAASALGDHGLIWLILAVVRGLRSERAWRTTIRSVSAVGVESALVNGPIKWIFRRPRPFFPGERPRPLRSPRTSSFPSGHATSAFCSAVLLSDGDPSLRPLYYALAVIVTWSRLHVRVHHASDSVGGILIGIALGEVFKRVAPLPPAGHPESPAPAGG